MKSRTSALIALTAVFAALPAQSQTPLFPGITRLDQIACGSPDTFKIAATAGTFLTAETIEVRDLGGVCGSACFCFEICLSLNAPGIGEIAVNCAPNSNNNATHRQRTMIGPVLLPVTGDYTLVVKDKQNAGRGEYSVVFQITDAPGNAIPLFDGDSLLGVINTPGAPDTYVFEGRTDDRATLDMLPNQGSVTPLLRVFDPIGRALAFPGNGHVDIVLPMDGEYTVLASSAVEKTGTYDLTFELIEASGHETCRTAANSAGAGATMHFAGSTSIAQNNLTLVAQGCPVGVSGMFFFGADQNQVPFGDGWLCVASPLLRLSAMTASDEGIGALALDFADPQSQANNIPPGSTLYFQLVYRDLAGPGGKGFNLSNGLELVFVP